MRNGSFVVGYVQREELEGFSGPGDFLVSGLGWLVRHGQTYIRESLSPRGDAEDLTPAGPAFASLLSARTAIGLSDKGELMLLQALT
jgi:hypothetical protein